MRILTLIDEVELVMRERLWLPWYEQYGVDFRDEMFRFPLEQSLPPENSTNQLTGL